MSRLTIKAALSTIIAIFWLLATSVFTAHAQTNYSKTIELPPLRISLAQLQSILDKGASLMQAANGSTPLYRDEIDLSSGETKITIPGHRLEPDRARIPEEIDGFEYTVSTRDPAPISRLQLRFDDYRRTLSVEGSSPDLVDASFAALRSELFALSNFFGGFVHRTFFYAILIALFVILLFVTLAVWERRHNNSIFIPIVLSLCIIIAVLILLPINDFLAGFLVTKGEILLLSCDMDRIFPLFR
jgi:hypothetical protein